MIVSLLYIILIITLSKIYCKKIKYAIFLIYFLVFFLDGQLVTGHCEHFGLTGKQQI